MKTKSMILAMFLVVAASVGCTKDGDGQTDGKTQSMVVKLPKAFNTRAIENKTTDAEDIEAALSNVHVFLMNGLSVAHYDTFDAQERQAGEKEFENVSNSIDNVIVVSDVPAGIDISGLSNANAIRNYAFTAASQQNGIENLTLVGEGAVEDYDPVQTGKKKAMVDLGSLTARFEIGTVKAGTGIKSVVLKGIFINNYYATNAKATPVTNASDATVWDYTITNGENTSTPTLTFDEDYSEPLYFNAGNDDVTLGGNKCYAYHVFTGNNVPHIVLLVAGEYDTGHFAPDVENSQFFVKFVTFKTFKKSGSTINSIEANKIYQIGLGENGIEINPEDLTDKPEQGQTDLMVEISVLEWDIEELTPSVRGN